MKEKIIAIIEEAISSARASGRLGLNEENSRGLAIVVERPQQAEHGDLSCPVAMQIASRLAAPDQAMAIAAEIAAQIEKRPDYGQYFSSLNCHAPGFINFNIGPALAAEILSHILRLGADYGFSQAANFSASGSFAADIDLAPAQEVFVKCCSLLRQATEPRVDILNIAIEPPIMSPGQWFDFLQECKSGYQIYRHLDLFQPPAAPGNSADYRAQARLILKLAAFPEAVAATLSNHRQAEHLGRYCLELASDLTDFWGHFNLGLGFFNDQLSVLKARLAVILAARQVLGNALGIIGLPVLEQI